MNYIAVKKDAKIFLKRCDSNLFVDGVKS